VELVRITLQGYRRFKDESTLNVDDKVIALVGPNEAGKTSFLRSLLHLNENSSFESDEYTRGTAASAIRVEASYALDDEDRGLLKGLPGGKAARLLTVYKQPDGERRWTIEPKLSRDLRPRQRAVAQLKRLLDSSWSEEQDEDEVLVPLREVVDDLDRETETLHPDALPRLDELTSKLDQLTLPKPFTALIDQLRAAEEAERAKRPLKVAVGLLEPRRPDFLFFGDDERLLEPTYSLQGRTNGALDNLLRLAKVDWDDFVQASASGDDGRIEALEKRANETLEEEFERSWSQKHMSLVPRLRVGDGALKLLVYRRGEAGEPDYVPITQRSDGVRQFIALRAFVASKETLYPVLLIDEAERHLHYDAQADLVEVLSEQTDAPKVIYSTHSAGCLPRDLGNGVRVVAPIEDTDYSKIENWFWQRGLGLSPLLLGMGASTFAFASARKAVIGEGPSEAILLPTLIREVAGTSALDYQVAPGLASASKTAIDDLDFVASRVVYLVDGDEGGASLKEGLLDNDVPEELILVLGEGSYKDLTLEDLIDEQAFLAVVNAKLKKQTDEEMTAGDLSSPVRWHSVRDWCASRAPAIKEPSKREVAQSLVSAKREEQIAGRNLRLVAKEHRPTIRKLHRDISKRLAKPSHKAKN
jgi:hypothetical protein